MLRDSLTVEKDARVSGNADVGRNLTVGGTSTLNGDVTVLIRLSIGATRKANTARAPGAGRCLKGCRERTVS